MAGPVPFLAHVISGVLSSQEPPLCMSTCPLPFSVWPSGVSLGWESTRKALICLLLLTSHLTGGRVPVLTETLI